MKKQCFFVLMALALALGMAFVSCGDGSTNDTIERQTVTYNGTNGDAKYTLTISPPPDRAALANDIFILIVERNGGEKLSAGRVKEVTTAAIILQPSVENAPAFSVTTSGEIIASISSTITYIDTTSEAAPGSLSNNQGGNNQGGNNQGNNNQGGNNQGGSHTHTWGSWMLITVPACTTPGAETRICSLDPSHTETRTIAALGHDWGPWEGLAMVAGWPSDQEPPKPMEERICRRDPTHKETRVAPSTDGNNQGDDDDQGGSHTHTWSPWTVTTAATCTAPGVETRVCTKNSSHTETRAIAAFGHDWGAWIETKAPSETLDGEETRTCAHDLNHKETRTVPAIGIGHDGTPGLAFELINENSYRVRKGTVTDGAVVIPATYKNLPVTEIGSTSDSFNYGAFSSTGITSITIPSSVTAIGKSAFSYCANLTGIAIPSSVTTIEEWAFSYCTSLTSFTIPSSVTAISDAMFVKSTNLASVVISSGVTTIGESAFSQCTGLTNVTIPSSVTTIGGFAFYGCTSLTGAAIPASVTSIGTAAFSFCGGLTSITIPASVTTLGSQAFMGWVSSQTISIQGHAGQDSADAAWGSVWRGGCSAQIVYQG